MRFLFERLVEPVAGLTEVSAEPYGAIADNLQCIVTSARLPQAEEGEIDLLNFGMPSVTGLGRDAVSQRERYQQRLSQLIERYEPRLTHVTVETAADGKLSLLTARCLGSCGLAPVAVFDGVVAGRVTPESIRQHTEEYLGGGQEDSAGKAMAAKEHP